MDCYSLKFKVSVDVGEGGVDWRVRDGVVDEECEAPTRPVTRPVATNKSVIGKRWIFRTCLQFCLLNACDDYVFLLKEMGEARRRLSKSVAIPLKDTTRRTRIWMDGGAEEKEENEESAHSLS